MLLYKISGREVVHKGIHFTPMSYVAGETEEECAGHFLHKWGWGFGVVKVKALGEMELPAGVVHRDHPAFKDIEARDRETPDV